jgi:adenylate kinase family enzyme
MALPKAVEAAEAKAEELIQAMYRQEAPAAEQEQPSESPAESSAEIETEEQGAEAQGIEVPESVHQQSVSSDEEATDIDQPADDPWENKYKVLAGKYSAEVPALAAERRELRHKLQQLEKELDSIKNAPSPERLVKDEEIAEYGENLVDLIRRAAREEVQSKDKEIEFLKSKLEAFEHQSQKNHVVDFYSRLGQLVPDWVAVNENKSFHKWLAQRDELTGLERQEMLVQAEAEKSPERVAAFFNAFKKQTQNAMAQANSRLEAQVSPAAEVSDGPPPGKRVWTREAITNFYRQVRLGQMSDSEALAIEKEIQTASLEGRVR